MAQTLLWFSTNPLRTTHCWGGHCLHPSGKGKSFFLQIPALDLYLGSAASPQSPSQNQPSMARLCFFELSTFGAETQSTDAKERKCISSLNSPQKSSGRIYAKVVCTYSFRFFIREDAGLPSSCEITVNFERVPGTSLVGINPVFTWRREERSEKIFQQHFHQEGFISHRLMFQLKNWSSSGAG
uniref:Uncharacterized protein n=1 Tax=Malurus cyaneus samueli TaxID=2593467 RepID=A0A8C5U4D3_9PASS